MSGQKNTTTILLSLLAAAIIGVAAWLLYFSPTLEAIEETKREVVTQQDFNFTLDLQVKELAAESKRLPDVIEEIVAITEDIPPVEDTPIALLDIHDAVIPNGILVQEVEFEDPVPVENVVTLAAAAQALEGSAYVSYVEELEFQGLVRTPFYVTFLGSWQDMLRILDALQYGDHRFFLIDSIEAEGQDPAEAAPPLPTILPGWLEVKVGGHFFTQIFEGINPNLKLDEDDIAELVEEAIENGARVPVDPNLPPAPEPAPSPAPEDGDV